MAVRPPEISYEPYFYFPRPGLVVPEIVIPEHRQKEIAEARNTRRYVYKGYTPVIRDQLEAHIYRTAKWGLVLPYVSDCDREEISDALQIHDADEFGKKHDLTTPDKSTYKDEAALELLEGVQNAKSKLTAEDDLLYRRYQMSKRLLEGMDPSRVDIDPNLILAKLVDVVENETYFHTWFHYLRELHGDEVLTMFPPQTFWVSFPRLRLYRQNIIHLGIPEAHMQVAQELFAEIEAFAKVSDQRDD